MTDDFPCCAPTGFSDEPTYTASEVKVLTETASKVAYALGRKDAGEEILGWACEERDMLVDLISGADGSDDATRHVLTRAGAFGDMAHRIAASQPPGATSDATSGVPGHPEVSEAVRSPQERCGNPRCLCNSGGATT